MCSSSASSYGPHTRFLTVPAGKYDRTYFCYEAGPTGYGLHQLVTSMGHECTVVAPSLIPRKPGDRVKTNRRDALTLAKLLRAGELTAVWVPDESHEAMRDLVRARSAAVETLRVHRQRISSFMLKLAVHRRARQAQQRALPRDGRTFPAGAPGINLFETFRSAYFLSTSDKKSRSTISCPIVSCSFAIRSSSVLPCSPVAKTLTAASSSSFFQV